MSFGRLVASLAVSVIFGLAACTPDTPAPSAGTAVPSASAPERWHVFLIAGSTQETVFDTGVQLLASKFTQRYGIHPHVFSSDRSASAPTRPATLDNIGSVASGLGMRPDDACFFYFTTHGDRHALEMSAERPLTPARLASLLRSTCGARKTVVVISACFSGIFLTPEIASDNRIVLTAARRDRSSFGCSNTEQVNVFDGCVLQNWDESGTWQALGGRVRSCVAQVERARRFTPPSEPQAHFGRAVYDLSTNLAPRAGTRTASR